MISIPEADLVLVNELIRHKDVYKVLGNPTFKGLKKVPFQLSDYLNSLKLQESHNEHYYSAVGDNIRATGAVDFWNKYGKQGEGIVIAGNDTGVDYQHPALRAKYRGLLNNGFYDHRYSWHDTVKDPANPCGARSIAPCDDDKHGTHTMGTMVGSESEARNVIGIAPKAKWIACRNMDRGNGSVSSYLECFEWFLAPYPRGGNPRRDGKPSMAPHVINNSWGCSEEEGCTGEEFLGAIRNLEAAGIMVVVSAGNEGPKCKTIGSPPAVYSNDGIIVGAWDHRSDKIARFSSRGPSRLDGGIGPDLVAPGVNIRSSVPGGRYAEADWSGTSMAGPHVAGAVALMWSANPSKIGKLNETLSRLQNLAIPKKVNESCGGVSGQKIPNNTSGYGLLNLTIQ